MRSAAEASFDMIVFDLECRAGGHRFEGWFGSSDDFDAQQRRGLVSCPQCSSVDVLKAPMAPRLTRKGNQIARPTRATAPAEPVSTAVATVPPTDPAVRRPTPMPPAAAAMMQAFVAMQAEALKASHWVGDKFATDARAMHYGDKDQAPIHGEATPRQAHELLEEGIQIAPILFPIAAPGQIN